LGASDFAYRIARQFGLALIEPQPGLVPFTASGALLQLCRELSGIALSARVETPDRLAPPRRAGFDEALLFTHRGLSGPAMLQISSYWQPGSPVTIDLAADARAWLETQRGSGARLATVLARRWPARFVEAWLAPDERPLKAYRAAELDEIARKLRAWTITPAGTEGYATAEVTTGGVDTRELSSKTFEARRVPGLYFIGEAVDVTGWLGGYNFQWAWASGHACGEALR
jgi:predicted Rossmann fold flavoprotein